MYHQDLHCIPDPYFVFPIILVSASRIIYQLTNYSSKKKIVFEPLGLIIKSWICEVNCFDRNVSSGVYSCGLIPLCN